MDDKTMPVFTLQLKAATVRSGDQQGGAVQGRGQDVPGGEGDRDHGPAGPPQHCHALRGLRQRRRGESPY